MLVKFSQQRGFISSPHQMENQKIIKKKMENQNLPDDLLPEILSRLPVKSLVRSKSVCKYWYALIQNPCFVSLHRNRAAAGNTDCVLVKRSLNGGIILSLVPNETPTQDIDISFTGINIHDLQLLGHCNGVVCLTNLSLNSTIVICNPSIREFRVLPQPSYKNDHFSTLGFGFDPSTNGYKVVKFGFEDIYFTDTDIDETIEMYDLSTDSWRRVELESSFEFGLNFHYSCCVSLNGDFYWYARNRGGDVAIIVFHMADEVFNEIPLPEVCLLDISGERRLFVLNDSLAVVLYPSGWVHPSCFPLLDKYFDIWVREEQGVEVSWIKKFVVGPLHGLDFALGFRLNGEFLLEDGHGRLMSYHIDTQQIKEYQVYGYRPPRCLEVLLHTESLVSVKRHN